MTRERDRRPRLVAAVPIDPPRKPTKTRKLKQHREIQAWRRAAETSASKAAQQERNPQP